VKASGAPMQISRSEGAIVFLAENARASSIAPPEW
jgi:hypothetical protein